MNEHVSDIETFNSDTGHPSFLPYVELVAGIFPHA